MTAYDGHIVKANSKSTDCKTTMSVFTFARTDFTIGRELQNLKQNSNNSYFTKGREIIGRQLYYITNETEAHCSVSKCCFGACSAVFIPRQQPVKSVETLPKVGWPAFLLYHLYLTFWLHQ